MSVGAGDPGRAAARPWLSILVPVRNVAPYLEACFASFMGQIDDGVEVIAVEDVSTDGSAALLDGLAARWPGRVRVLRHAVNAGIAATRNTLLDAAAGEYLWFVDSDDLVEPGALAQLRGIVQAHAPDLVLCDYRTLRERPRLLQRLRGEHHRRTFDGPSGEPCRDPAALYRGLLLAGHLHMWSKVSRRALWFDGLRFPVGRTYEDLAVAPRLALRAASFFHCPARWIAYRQHAGSILGRLDERKIGDLMSHLPVLRDALAASALAGRPDAVFALAHLCARSYIAAARALQRLGAGAETLRRTREAFEAATPLPAPALFAAYLRRGWLARALRLRHWLRAGAG